jgi:Ca-activated chloride channel family protein
LTTLGFGQGNYNDHLLEQLADHGNGNYAYIDTLNEARKVLVEEIASTLQVIAKDVKIQIEFNPATVAEYRLIGYENRMLRREDFNNDRIDAGEIGSGHTVTALYELRLVGSETGLIDPLRYATAETAKPAPSGDELGFLRLRYKAPDSDRSTLVESPVMRADVRTNSDTSDDFRFAAAVAAFGQSLKGGHYLGNFGLDDVDLLARGARGEDRSGYRGEFLSLVALAGAIEGAERVASR